MLGKHLFVLRLAIIKKCIADSDFKKELIQDPRSALKKEFNIDVPEDVHLTVIEETEKRQWFVLPYINTGELTIEEQKTVVGGFCCSLDNEAMEFVDKILDIQAEMGRPMSIIEIEALERTWKK